MAKTFVVGDTHFYDENILHFCDRPFKTVEEMNNYMVFRWNELVSNEDTVIVNGDFACGTEEELVEVGKCLKGKKVLVRGNHDTMPDEVYYAAGFEKVYDYPILVNEFFLVSHEPLFVQRNGVFANVLKVKKFLSVVTTIQCLTKFITPRALKRFMIILSS